VQNQLALSVHRSRPSRASPLSCAPSIVMQKGPNKADLAVKTAKMAKSDLAIIN
jgi:hypothetical protein